MHKQKQCWGHGSYTLHFLGEQLPCRWRRSLLWSGNAPRAVHFGNHAPSSNVTQGFWVTHTAHQEQVSSVDLLLVETPHMGASNCKHHHTFWSRATTAWSEDWLQAHKLLSTSLHSDKEFVRLTFFFHSKTQWRKLLGNLQTQQTRCPSRPALPVPLL